MLKENKVAKTVYLPESIANYVTSCSKVSCRSFSGEIEFMLRKLRDKRQSSDLEAIAMAEDSDNLDQS
jgi:hypothetical protein